MRRLHVFIALVAALTIPVSGLITAAPAMAFNVGSVYRDCETNGQLTGHYSRAELQAAINGMPSNMAEYSDCQVIIQRALLAASGPSVHHSKIAGTGASNSHGGGGSGKASGGNKGSSSTGSTGGGSTRLNATAAKGNTVNLGSSDVRPGSTGSSDAARSLPTLLLVVLVLLALTAVSGGAVAIRRRVVARHGT
jgi:hypothetical protein